MTKKHNTTTLPPKNVVETTTHSDGSVARKTAYVNGVIHGADTWRDENGQKCWEVMRKDGKRHGRTTYWYKDGTKKKEAMYRGGKKNGVSAWWHDNGTINCEIMWVDDKRHGVATMWDENGQKLQEERWWGGKRHGVAKRWEWSMGYARISEELFWNDKRHGVKTERYKNGIKSQEIYRIRGVPHGKIMWNNEGKVVEVNFPIPTKISPPIPKSRLITHRPLKS